MKMLVWISWKKRVRKKERNGNYPFFLAPQMSYSWHFSFNIS
jgi:hypothetical protein